MYSKNPVKKKKKITEGKLIQTDATIALRLLPILINSPVYLCSDRSPGKTRRHRSSKLLYRKMADVAQKIWRWFAAR